MMFRTESERMPILVLMMKSAMRTPRKPSRLKWKNMAEKMPTKVEKERAASNIASRPEARRLAESWARPTDLT